MKKKDSMAQIWQKMWGKGLWYAPWSKIVADLTLDNVSYRLQGERHSIWEILNHIIFWREYVLRDLSGNPPDKKEIEKRNWEGPSEINEETWKSTLKRFKETQKEFHNLLQSGKIKFEWFIGLVAHDSYHFGQIMHIRALLNLPHLD